ncbi:5-oxoprolinase subunit PxpA [uncultured Agrococcus sp.]|uniref:LamB/YcsF family protein n=1 Tax=uncultured Agrococcus sp. TaxID=382258 RepID=UPI0025DDC4D4|nr:5-oxoprolinase subunit PxpA [uncultured Agrococcus sp.]
MVSIDLNSDLGENTPARIVGDDAAMLQIVTSANVSCGFHAGDPEGIKNTLTAAVHNSVSIGAHPGYRDYENFGRLPVDVDSSTLQAHVEYQLGAIAALSKAVGGEVVYVKPHGALYNTVAIDERQARDVVNAVKAIDPGLVLLGLAGGVVLDIAERAGLETAAEAFADRAYTSEGTLVSRSQPGAVLHDVGAVAERMVRLANEGVVRSIHGIDVPVRADSICVHGDSAGAISMARETRAALRTAGIELRPFAGSRA